MTRRKSLVGILVLVVLAGLLAALRHGQARTILLPAQVTWGEINHLDFDPATGIIQVTGTDPYGHLQLPAYSIPLRRLTLEFTGPAQPGGWYVYPCPAHLRNPVINQDWVVTAVPTATATGHALVWELGDSQLARIDFPDELNVPMTLERVVLETDFFSSRSPWCLGLIAALTVAILWTVALALAGHWHRPVAQFIFMLALVVVKIALAQGLGQTFMTNLPHDDGLFMAQGRTILAGDWLGPFNELTLAKGPTYSIFLALSAASGLPLQLNELLLHALACFTLIGALGPWVRPAGWRIGLFAAVLFDPQSMSAELIARVLRSGIHPALTLFMFAGLLGTLARSNDKWSRWLPWSALAGAAGIAFWYSREEGIWALPSALLLLSLAALRAWAGERHLRWARAALIVVLPAAVFLSGRTLLQTINQHHYGVPIGVDVLEGSFPAAHGAIVRVTNPDPIPGVPTTRATRELIYAASPSLARLRDRFENEMLPKWRQAGWKRYDHPRANEEIRNGWFSWALREAAAKEGFYTDAATAERYWQNVADEINAAVDAHRLPGGAPRHGFFPRWESSYLQPSFQGWFQAVDLIVRADDFKAHAIPSRGHPDDIAAMAALYHATPVHEVADTTVDAQFRLMVHAFYAWLGWPLTALALVATGVQAWHARRDVAARFALGSLLALWGGITALCLVVSLVQATSFTAIIGAYLGPLSGLFIVLWFLAPLWAFHRNPFVASTPA